MVRNQDISFGTGSAVLIDAQSSKYTCKSSFSTLLTEQSTTSHGSAVFSFSSTGGSNGHDFASPVLTLPSFTFFGSSLVVDQGSYEVDLSVRASDVDLLHKGNFTVFCFNFILKCKLLYPKLYVRLES